METEGQRVRQENEGESLSVGLKTELMLPSEWLSGAYSVFDQLIEPGVIVPVHVHDDADQVAWVISGALMSWVDGEQEEVGPGGCAFRPAGRPHSIWSISKEPVRILEITSPGGPFQEYMRTLSGMIDSGAASPEAVAEMAAGFGIRFLPEITEQLVAKNDLTGSGSFWKDA
jgi:mannose-6-phosphate isomerase-like protein (cupin superfamily)